MYDIDTRISGAAVSAARGEKRAPTRSVVTKLRPATKRVVPERGGVRRGRL